MIFDGIKWRICKRVVMMPYGFDDGKIAEHGSNYMRFGKVIPQNKIRGKRAVETNYKWEDGEFVFAIPIESDGYSLTNMMYAKPEFDRGVQYNRAYLAYKGSCYTAKWVNKRVLHTFTKNHIKS